MAFTGSNWGRRVKVTGLAPASSLSGYVALLTLDNIPVEAIDAGANSALNGGGDLRFSTDNAGTNQLSCEVVSFVTSATPGSRDCQIYVRFDSYASATRDVWMFYSKTGETQPAVGAAFGRNAVWVDEHIALHLESFSTVDSTGNTTPAPDSSVETSDFVDSVLGKGFRPTTSSERIKSLAIDVNGTVGSIRFYGKTPTGSGDKYAHLWANNTSTGPGGDDKMFVCMRYNADNTFSSFYGDHTTSGTYYQADSTGTLSRGAIGLIISLLRR